LFEEGSIREQTAHDGSGLNQRGIDVALVGERLRESNQIIGMTKEIAILFAVL
jgi:hypothetical protein